MALPALDTCRHCGNPATFVGRARGEHRPHGLCGECAALLVQADEVVDLVEGEAYWKRPTVGADP